MGMTLSLTAITDEEINRISTDQDALDAYVEAQEAALESGQPTPESVDLDKACHAVHVLVSGSIAENDTPASLLLGGAPLDEPEEDGFGAGIYAMARADKVQAFAALLEALDDDTLRTRIAEGALAAPEIYPHTWQRNEAGDVACLLAYARDVRRFLAARVAAGEGVLINLG
ncbi:MAG: DUF1877 family protein [Pseudomonadota bacterium]